MPKFISTGPPLRNYGPLNIWKNSCFLGTPFSKNKSLTFGIFNESNIWAKVYQILKFEVYGSTIVEIAGR